MQWTYGGDCTGVNDGSLYIGDDNERNITIRGLEEDITYSLSVRNTNDLHNWI